MNSAPALAATELLQPYIELSARAKLPHLFVPLNLSEKPGLPSRNRPPLCVVDNDPAIASLLWPDQSGRYRTRLTATPNGHAYQTAVDRTLQRQRRSRESAAGMATCQFVYELILRRDHSSERLCESLIAPCFANGDKADLRSENLVPDELRSDPRPKFVPTGSTLHLLGGFQQAVRIRNESVLPASISRPFSALEDDDIRRLLDDVQNLMPDVSLRTLHAMLRAGDYTSTPGRVPPSASCASIAALLRGDIRRQEGYDYSNLIRIRSLDTLREARAAATKAKNGGAS